jgi:dipeptidyl-peptidase-4
LYRLLPKIILLLIFSAITTLSAQQKKITLEEIMGGTFQSESLSSLRSLNNGKEYSVLNYNSSLNVSTIDVYDYLNGKKVRTLLNSMDLNYIDHIISYEFSEDESKILLATQLEQIYRHSSKGRYFVYDLNDQELIPVSENNVQSPYFNSTADKIAYGYENNLYIKDLNNDTTNQITFDGEKNKIINGITDWVYEEEFSFVRAFDWNKDGTTLAFLRFDETEVPFYSMDIMGTNLYPTQQVFKYPKAGEKNAEVSLHIYDISTDNVSEIDVSQYNSYYIPRILWTKDPNILSVRLTNRYQNIQDLIFVDAITKETKLIHQEKDNAYVEVTDDLTFLKNNSFIWTSELDGWNHIYHYDSNGKLINQITKGDWEVTRYYGFDEKTGNIFYQSSESGSINRDVYSISLTGTTKKRLSFNNGNNGASFSSDYSYFIGSYSSADTPYVYSLNKSNTGEQLRVIEDNETLKNKLDGYMMSPKEYSTININGYDLNMYMIKPLDFDPDEEYPLFMYQYSGPGSQSVANRWGGTVDLWHQMLAQEGFIIACVDGRGTGLKGRNFKKMTQRELGKYEVEDQIAVANKLGKLPYIDASRIGIWGWSYGGFMSANCLFQASDVFSMAIAVAPVSSWRYYDTIYTERYMATPQENPLGYDNNSPINHVDKLKGDLLLVHGGADDNVHLQNTMRMVEALIQANKQFDWAVYPDKNHSIYGGNTRLHLFTKMTNFVKENFGKKKMTKLGAD